MDEQKIEKLPTAQPQTPQIFQDSINIRVVSSVMLDKTPNPSSAANNDESLIESIILSKKTYTSAKHSSVFRSQKKTKEIQSSMKAKRSGIDENSKQNVENILDFSEQKLFKQIESCSEDYQEDDEIKVSIKSVKQQNSPSKKEEKVQETKNITIQKGDHETCSNTKMSYFPQNTLKPEKNYLPMIEGSKGKIRRLKEHLNIAKKSVNTNQNYQKFLFLKRQFRVNDNFHGKSIKQKKQEKSQISKQKQKYFNKFSLHCQGKNQISSEKVFTNKIKTHEDTKKTRLLGRPSIINIGQKIVGFNSSQKEGKVDTRSGKSLKRIRFNRNEKSLNAIYLPNCQKRKIFKEKSHEIIFQS